MAVDWGKPIRFVMDKLPARFVKIMKHSKNSSYPVMVERIDPRTGELEYITVSLDGHWQKSGHSFLDVENYEPKEVKDER